MAVVFVIIGVRIKVRVRRGSWEWVLAMRKIELNILIFNFGIID